MGDQNDLCSALLQISSKTHSFQHFEELEETKNYFVLIENSTISVILGNRPDLSLRCR